MVERMVNRLICRLRGHRLTPRFFDGRGKRVTVFECVRCGYSDVARATVTSRNRAIRRHYARRLAKELAR